MDEGMKKVYEILDNHGYRIVRVESAIEDHERRLNTFEKMRDDIDHVRSGMDILNGKMSIMTWLLFAIAGGVIAAGFAMLRN